MSKGYIYAEVEITDAAEYDEYRPLAAASIEAFGGRYIVRRGEPEGPEGNRDVRLVVVLEFESRARALEWYHSPHSSGEGGARQGGQNPSRGFERLRGGVTQAVRNQRSEFAWLSARSQTFVVSCYLIWTLATQAA